MGLLDRGKRIVDIKRDKRKKHPEANEGTDIKAKVISKGSIGTLDGLDFTVIGRLVYDWGGGCWEEFYLEFSDTDEYKWLSKEGTTLGLLEEVESVDVPDPESLKEGGSFEFQGEKVKVNEVGEAKITSVEGSFPWSIASGARVIYADCEFERTGEILSLEKPRGSRIEIYRGNRIPKGSLDIF